MRECFIMLTQCTTVALKRTTRKNEPDTQTQTHTKHTTPLPPTDSPSLALYLRGKALDAPAAYNPEAEACLTKAVKLDPTVRTVSLLRRSSTRVESSSLPRFRA
jgi:hypothetical protein